MTTIEHSIGPNFSNEVFAANLNGLPFSWSSTQVEYDETVLTSAQVTSLTAVIAAHNPATQPVPSITQCVQAGETFLASQGWGEVNQKRVMILAPSLTGTLLSQFQANYAAIQAMYLAAETPATFNVSNYTIPNPPETFGLSSKITL